MLQTLATLFQVTSQTCAWKVRVTESCTLRETRLEDPQSHVIPRERAGCLITD